MNKFILATATVALLSVGIAGGAFAQSAKFAATWDTDDVTVGATAACSDSDGGCLDVDGPNMAAELNMATIHVSTHKSVLIGVSSQIGIHLVTVAKGKGGLTGNYSSSALAQGDVVATVTLVNRDPSGPDCQVAPGPIVLKAESRQLTVGVNASDEDITVSVGIDTNSVSASHFNFLGVECEQGWYDAKVNFDLSALASASGFDASADVLVTLGDRMITLQEVRAVKGSLVDDATN
jgi:hypothetical protein